MNNDIKNIVIKELGINDKNIGNILYDNKEIFITLIAQNEQDKVIIDLKDKIMS